MCCLCTDAIPSVFEWSSTKPHRKPPTHRNMLLADHPARCTPGMQKFHLHDHNISNRHDGCNQHGTVPCCNVLTMTLDIGLCSGKKYSLILKPKKLMMSLAFICFRPVIVCCSIAGWLRSITAKTAINPIPEHITLNEACFSEFSPCAFLIIDAFSPHFTPKRKLA